MKKFHYFQIDENIFKLREQNKQKQNLANQWKVCH